MNRQALLPQWPAACARQGRTGLDQVGKPGVAQRQLDWILCLDQTQAWALFCVFICGNERRCQEALLWARAASARPGHSRQAQVECGLRLRALSVEQSASLGYRAGEVPLQMHGNCRAQQLLSCENRLDGEWLTDGEWSAVALCS